MPDTLTSSESDRTLSFPAEDIGPLGPGVLHPSGRHWREYQAAVRAHNASPEDDSRLSVAFSEAQDRFIYAEDATLQGVYFKLRLLAQVEKCTVTSTTTITSCGRASS